MKYYSQTQHFNICHPVLHFSIQRTLQTLQKLLGLLDFI